MSLTLKKLKIKSTKKKYVTLVTKHSLCMFLLCLSFKESSAVTNFNHLTAQSLQMSIEQSNHPHIRAQTRFWNKIFFEFDSGVNVIHDANHPEHIIDLIEFQYLEKKISRTANYSRTERSNITKRYLERYRLGLKRFATAGANAVKFGAIEGRIFQVYSTRPHLLKKLYKGQISIRSQSGLRDSMIAAGKKAQELLPQMEKIFREESVPPILTRIAFVESMFNARAQSKVGASGLWQFMPATAKSYMIVTRNIDERHSPLKATRAAARLLRDNFERLKSWPLAITAYNHGATGVSNAVRSVGSNDLGEIILKYKSAGFGFASSNFYAEFISAAKSYEKLMRFGEIKPHYSDVRLSSIRLPHKISIQELVEKTPINQTILKELNGCLNDVIFSKYRNQDLPANFELFVPTSMLDKIKLSFRSMAGKKNAYNE